MAFQARSLAESNPSQALLLALEADRLRPDADTLGALLVALLANPALLRSVYTDDPIGNIAFSPDGSHASGGTANGRVVEIDTSTGTTVSEWQASEGLVFGTLGPRGGLATPVGSSQVLGRDERGAVRVLASDGFVPPLLFGTVAVAVPRGRLTPVAIATASGVRLVDFNTGSVLNTVQSPPAIFLAFSDDGTRLAIETGYQPATVTIVDPVTGRTIAPAVTLPAPALIALNRTGTRLGAGSHGGGDARVVDVATGETLGTPLVANQFRIAFSNDGSLMGAVSLSGAVQVFDAATGEPAAEQTVSFGSPSGLGFTADNTKLLVASTGGEIAVLDLVGRQKLGRPAETSGWLGTFSPDGALFAVPIDGSDNDTAIVDVATGKLIRTLRPARSFPNWGIPGAQGPFEVAFSPDGEELAIGSLAYDGQPAEIEVFSVADGTSLRRLAVPGVLFVGEPLVWSPDGQVLAGGVFNRVVRINAITGELLQDLALSDLKLPISLAYDVDGRFAVAGYPGKAWIFDASDRPIRTYGPPLNPYYVAVWGPGGTVVLPNTATGEVRVVEPVEDRQIGPTLRGSFRLCDGRGWI